MAGSIEGPRRVQDTMRVDLCVAWVPWSHFCLYGPVWSCMAPFGLVSSGMVRYGLVCSSIVQYGPIYGPIWPFMVQYGLVWSSMVLCVSVWSLSVPNGPVLSCIPSCIAPFFLFGFLRQDTYVIICSILDFRFFFFKPFVYSLLLQFPEFCNLTLKDDISDCSWTLSRSSPPQWHQ